MQVSRAHLIAGLIEGKHIQRTQNGCELILYLLEITVNETFTVIFDKYMLRRELHNAIHTHVEV